jgi:hypothetical protein
MKGTGFSEIRNTIVSKFKAFDGVPKLGELPAVTLFET